MGMSPEEQATANKTRSIFDIGISRFVKDPTPSSARHEAPRPATPRRGGARHPDAKNPEIVLSPPERLAEIDEVNGPIYDRIDNGVYKSGLATSQEAHEHAVDALFEQLDVLEERLAPSGGSSGIGSPKPT